MEVTCTGERESVVQFLPAEYWVCYSVYIIYSTQYSVLTASYIEIKIWDFLPSNQLSCYYPPCPWSRECFEPSSRILVIESTFFPDWTKLPELKIFWLFWSSRSLALILPEWSGRRRKGSPRHSAGKNSFWRRNYCPVGRPPDHCAALSRGWNRGGSGARHGMENPGGLRRKDRSDPPHFPFLRWTPPCRGLRSPVRSWLSVRLHNPPGGSTVCGGEEGSAGRGVSCPREAWYPSPRLSPSRASRQPPPPPSGSPV